MSKAKNDRVDVQIFDRAYQLSCPPEEKELLLQCVSLVDTRMRQVKANSRLQGADRIAVMAALTIARDCLAQVGGQDPDAVQKKLAEIAAALDAALVPQERLF
jgi:cell division protein ZapA